jgi:CheY-like chemotaxis protein
MKSMSAGPLSLLPQPLAINTAMSIAKSIADFFCIAPPILLSAMIGATSCGNTATPMPIPTNAITVTAAPTNTTGHGGKGRPLHFVYVTGDPLIDLPTPLDCIKYRGTRLILPNDDSVVFDAIAAGRPDIVIVELEAGNSFGWDLLDRLRSDPATSAIPVVVRARNTWLVERSAVRRGIDDAPVLPASPADQEFNRLVTTMESLVGDR